MERSVVSGEPSGRGALPAVQGQGDAIERGDFRRLAEAFERFTRKTAKLEGAYDRLKRHVKKVNRELEEKNAALRSKIEELDATRTYLNNILESMGSGVIAVDLDGRISTLNTAAERITGYQRAEVLRRPYADVFPGQDGSPTPILASLESRAPRVIKERALRRKDGQLVPVGVSSSPVHDGNGGVAGALEIFHDLTEMKQLEERIRCADRLAALGQMAATVAHEIRNPLGGIEGFAALLERDLRDWPAKREMAHQIVEGVRSLDRIVTSLLDFTRPVQLRLREARLAEIADAAVALAEPEMGTEAPGVEVVRRYAEHDAALVDPEQMQRVVLNLARNAWQAMPDGGELLVSTSADDDAVCLRVRDSGCGMTEEVRAKLFSPFFTTKEAGTGLGLSVVQKIVLAHQGAIEMRSTPGAGTTVIVTIPRRRSPAWQAGNACTTGLLDTDSATGE